MNEPLVSIVIPVYNGSNYMKEAIDSALNQTYKNIEVLVINDGSCDNEATEKIALSYGNKIRYIKKENGGVSSALNLGIKNMKGEYFSWLSHDDVYAPCKIEHQIKALSVCSDKKTVVLSSSCHIDENSEFIAKKEQNRFDTDRVIKYNEVLNDFLKKGSFNGCAFLIPRQTFEECGLFDENLRYLQDFLMWFMIFSNKYSLVYVGENDVYGRIHGNQLTQRGRSLFKKESIEVCDKILPILLALSTQKDNFLYTYACMSAVYGNRSNVKKCIKLSAKKNLLTIRQKIILRLKSIYGCIRPAIRKVYYRIFRKIKVS